MGSQERRIDAICYCGSLHDRFVARVSGFTPRQKGPKHNLPRMPPKTQGILSFAPVDSVPGRDFD